jgi:hypothetical protein
MYMNNSFCIFIIISTLAVLLIIGLHFGFVWVFLCIMGLFGHGIGKAIKILYVNRNVAEFYFRLKYPLLGLPITIFVGGLLHHYKLIDRPTDDWLTWLIIVGPYIMALFTDVHTLKIGEE